MREFRDDQGRPWMVALTVAAADRVRGMVTLDVADDVEQPDGSVQRQTRQVPFDLIDAGTKALEQELVDFFPQRLRRMVGLLVAKMDEMATELLTQAEAGLEAATVESLLGQSGTPSTKPLESSGSTPASGLSETSSLPATAA